MQKVSYERFKKNTSMHAIIPPPDLGLGLLGRDRLPLGTIAGGGVGVRLFPGLFSKIIPSVLMSSVPTIPASSSATSGFAQLVAGFFTWNVPRERGTTLLVVAVLADVQQGKKVKGIIFYDER